MAVLPDPETEDKPPERPSSRGLHAALVRIPLPARVVFYGLFFLATAIGVLPWLASRLEVAFPVCGVELGWLRLPGVAFFVACLVTYVWLSYVLTSRGRGAYVEFDPPDALVTSGPYRWVRNPIAACVVGMLLGEGIALSSTGVLLLFLVSLLLAHLQVVCLEEPLLRKRFGRAYDDYCARVPRWIPRRPRSFTEDREGREEEDSNRRSSHAVAHNAREMTEPRQAQTGNSHSSRSSRPSVEDPGEETP